MDKETINQLDADLEHAGEPTSMTPVRLQLEQMRITPDKELKPMSFLFRLFGKPCFPRRELVGLTGKAKSGKTFVTSMLMARALSRQKAGKRVSCLQRTEDKPLRVLWYDTEQSDESTQDILKNRIAKMTDETSGEAPAEEGATTAPDVFNVRAAHWNERRLLLKEAIKYCKPELVIIDGIRDLVNDINDGCLAQEVMEELMQLATEGDCCVVCVLHQNKSGEDHNLRGWIGTELMNKAFEVYSCEKLMPQRIFKMEQTLTRKYDISQTMYFEVGADGLPANCTLPADEGEGDSPAREPLPQLNKEYIVSEDDGDKWHFDVMRLFLDAIGTRAEISGSELRDRVRQLSNIRSWKVYNGLLEQALQQKVIEKTKLEGRIIYRPAPF